MLLRARRSSHELRHNRWPEVAGLTSACDPVIFMTIVTRCRELSQFVNAKTAPDAAKPDLFCNYCLHRKGCSEGGNEP
jgi:hypothetical protein